MGSIRISYSSLSQYKSCPKAYYFNKIAQQGQVEIDGFYAFSGSIGQFFFE